jgi:hypothetical protein
MIVIFLEMLHIEWFHSVACIITAVINAMIKMKIISGSMQIE